jgi:hypothetical protein
MAAHDYAGNTTRPHWGGASSDVDIHLEVYDGELDTRFQYMAMFRALSTQRSVADRSNTYRIDRLNTSSVKGRTSGVKLDATKVTNDKLVLTVDTVLYIRNPIDYQDDWTAPDFLREMGQNNGSEFAEVFDQAHLIQVIKGRDWVAPDHLKPAFNDGAEVVCNLIAAADTQAEKEANAVALAAAHKVAVDTLIKRKVPLADIITLVYTDEYSVLLEHPKLLNLDFSGTEANNYAGRRVTRMNSLPVVESTEFPIAVDTAHPLGPNFNVTADDATCHMVVFSKSKTLVTVEAKPFTSRIWDDEGEFCNVLDCYAMYTVGQRRPDTAVVISCVYA